MLHIRRSGTAAHWAAALPMPTLPQNCLSLCWHWGAPESVQRSGERWMEAQTFFWHVHDRSGADEMLVEIELPAIQPYTAGHLWRLRHVRVITP